MWKIIRYGIYFSLFILIFSITYKLREYCYVPFIQSGIDKFTNSQLKFRNFDFDFPLNIILHNINYKDKIFIDTATLRFEPMMMLKNLKRPFKSLVAVDIDRLTIIENNSSFNKAIQINNDNKQNSKELIKKLTQANLSRIFISKANIVYFDNSFKAVDTKISFEDKTIISTNLIYKNSNISVYGYFEKKDDIINSDFQVSSDGTIMTEINCNTNLNLHTNTMTGSVNIDNMVLGLLKIGKAKINLMKDNDKTIVNYIGENGNMFFEAKDDSFSVWNSTGTLTLCDTNGIATAQLVYDAHKKETFNMYAQIKNITVLGSDIGNIDINSVKNSEQFSFNCKHNLENEFIVFVNPGGNYTVNVYNKNKKIGNAIGNYKTSDLSIDMQNIPIRKIMFLSGLNKYVYGTLSLYGKLNSNSGTINLQAKNLSSKQLKKFDVIGTLTKDGSSWFCNVATQDKKLEMKGFYKARQKSNIDFFFSEIDSSNIFKILGWKNPKVSGTATGSIKYNTIDAATTADIKLKKGTLLNNAFKTWDICFDISQNKINISTFSFIGNTALINLTTLLDFNKNSPQSYITCDIKNFKINDININSQIDFTGTISQNTDEISGELNAKQLDLNGLNFQHSSQIILSAKQLTITNINDNNNLSGDVIYDFKNKNISANIKAVRAKLSKYYSKVTGRLSLDFNMEGQINNPIIRADCKVENGSYNNSIPFDLNSKIITKNNNTYLSHLKIFFDKNKNSLLEASGRIGLNNNNVNVKIKNFSHRNINTFVGFITPFKGTFYGDGSITGKIQNLFCKLNIYSDKLFVKNIEFNKLNSKVELRKNSISVKDSKVQLKDSEIGIVSGIFDVKTGKYSSLFKFINTHVGPFDIFGILDLNGEMVKKFGGSIYTGNILLKDFWLNRQKIDNLPINYVIKNKKFNFETDKEAKISVNGGIDFNKYPNIVLDKISIFQDDQLFETDGMVSSQHINLVANAEDIDASIITDIFNLPFDMQGTVNARLNAGGTISTPSIDLVAKSRYGSIFNIFYSALNFKVRARNNMLNIEEFNINKRGEYNASITGMCPFWLDSSLKKKMYSKELNINYELIDDKCGILKEYTQELVSAKSGKINLKGSLTGTLDNIINTGKLTANINNITTNSYVQKIKNLALNFEWTNNLLEIKTFTAKIGSGVVNALGNISLSGLSPKIYDLSVKTSKKGIPIVIHELPIPTSGFFNIEKTQALTNFSKAVPTFDFKLYGNTDDLKLTGWAKLENAKFCFPSPVKTHKVSDFSITDIFPNLFIDVDLLSANSTNFENSFANIYLDGKVNLKGYLDAIKANGIVESAKGRVSYVGTDFDVVNSKIEIINNEVFITGEGESEVYGAGRTDAEIIKVFVDRSRTDDLKVRFASKNDPTMDSKTALYRLTKTDPSQSTNLDTSTDYLVKQQAIRLLGSNVAMPLANTVLKKTGLVDNVRLGYVNQDTLEIKDDQEPTIAELLYGMKYSVEKNINRLLQIGYSVTFDQIEREIDLKHAVEMSVKVKDALFLRGSYGLNSDNPSYEPEKKVMLEQRLRFGGGKKK